MNSLQKSLVTKAGYDNGWEDNGVSPEWRLLSG